MNLKFGLLCEHTQDTGHGRFDLIGVYSVLYLERFPSTVDRLTLVTLHECKAEDIGTEKNFAFRITAASGTSVVDLQGTGLIDALAVPGVPPELHAVVLFDNVEFAEPGRHTIDCSVDGVLLGSVAFYVIEKEMGDDRERSRER